MRNTILRLRRFLAIWRLSRRLELTVGAVRARSQAVVIDFLRAGGRVNGDVVEYRNARLPRSMFMGADLGGLGYVTQLVDHGTTIARGAGEVYVATLPSGLVFEAPSNAFVDTLCMLVERFVIEEYAWLDLAGHVAIDVGAYVGDSAIYFATRGAVYVYGYEPDPIAYEAARRNVELNHISRVNLTHAAVVGPHPPGDDDRISLGEILSRAAAEHAGVPIVCKIDCEGCEYEIFAPGNVSLDVVRPVSQMMVEYHWRSPDAICNALEQLGFQVETASGPRGVGWIRAHKMALL